jgi:hypothetical protein
MRSEIRDRILKRTENAAKQAEKACFASDKETICECVFQYICSKFWLDPEVSRGMTLLQMGEASLEKALEMKIPVAAESERATTCGMAGSAVMKITLLLVAAKKDFGIDPDPHVLGAVKTPEELGGLIWTLRKGNVKK